MPTADTTERLLRGIYSAALYLLATVWRAGSNVVESAAWQPAEAHRQV